MGPGANVGRPPAPGRPCCLADHAERHHHGVTLDRGAMMAKMQHVFMPLTLPVVLSRDEVKRLIAHDERGIPFASVLAVSSLGRCPTPTRLPAPHSDGAAHGAVVRERLTRAVSFTMSSGAEE